MMDALSAFHFVRPWWLALLVPALALVWWQRRADDASHTWATVMDPHLLKLLTVGEAGGRHYGPTGLLLALWVIGIVAVAGPTWRRLPQPFAPPTAPAMIVLKVAPSMATTDLAPTRLDRARQKVADLLAARSGAANGLIAYAGSAHLVLPPTSDGAVIVSMAKALEPAIMPVPGDALAKAVALARDTLQQGGEGGSILVVADTVAPDQIAALAAEADGPPVVVLADAPETSVQSDRALADAVRALGATEIVTTVDGSDVAALARKLSQGPAPAAVGAQVRWEEAGYWLTPLIALGLLAWFRRGWVLR